MGIIPVPIIIYRDKKSDKEIREEMERERKWNELMEKEEARKREMERKAEQEKIWAKLKKEKAFRKAVDAAEMENPWEYRILPDGWGIFGQVSICELPWDGTEEEYESLIENKE